MILKLLKDCDYGKSGDQINLPAAMCKGLVSAGLAEEVKQPEPKPAPKAPDKVPEPKTPAKFGPSGYDALTVEELHAEATKRNIEGRGSLTTKADLVKALEKADKTKK